MVFRPRQEDLLDVTGCVDLVVGPLCVDAQKLMLRSTHNKLLVNKTLMWREAPHVCKQSWVASSRFRMSCVESDRVSSDEFKFIEFPQNTERFDLEGGTLYVTQILELDDWNSMYGPEWVGLDEWKYIGEPGWVDLERWNWLVLYDYFKGAENKSCEIDSTLFYIIL